MFSYRFWSLKGHTIVKKLLLSFIVAGGLLVVLAYFVVTRQGLEVHEIEAYDSARIRVDSDRIPLIESPDWQEIIKAQGFVTASERLFQMEMTRRYASGRLAEVFGAQALKSDIEQRREDWQTVAQESYLSMDAEDKTFCEAYASGVNTFMEEHSWRIGIEFLLLGLKPEKWRCTDSLLVLMVMAKRLSSSFYKDLRQQEWASSLPPDWTEFLYPRQHPWNKPLFGPQTAPPPWPRPLAKQPFSCDEEVEDLSGDLHFYGSNSWAYRDKDKRFLANDPHLGQSVPQLWYPVRLKRSEKDWVVGVSLPGLPGVILGMNAFHAWTMTNIGEDVDSAYLEEINFESQQYVERLEKGQKLWRDLELKEMTVKVKKAEDEKFTAFFTSRGPVFENPEVQGQFVSRQWLPLKPGVLSLPILKINRSRTWSEFRAAFSQLGSPGQNVTFMDRRGRLGYLASGRGVARSQPSRFVESAQAPSWQGILPAGERPQRYWSAATQGPAVFVTANQRMWVDEHRHTWASDDRAKRLSERLAELKDPRAETMQKLFLDTRSEFHLTFRDFLVKNADSRFLSDEVKKNWSTWQGRADERKRLFTQLDYGVRVFENLALARVKRSFWGEASSLPPYHHYAKRAWMLHFFEAPQKMTLLGLEATELANCLVQKMNGYLAGGGQPYDLANSWRAQHPFADRLPLLGAWFRLPEVPQVGFRDLVRVEAPRFGASMRLLFDMSDPGRSGWTFPVGQSGHFHRQAFSNFRQRYLANQFTPLLPSDGSFGEPASLPSR